MLNQDACFETKLSSATAKFCAELRIGKLEAGPKSRLTNATLTFVEWKGRCLGITNQHVVAEKYRWNSQQLLFTLALPRPRPLPGRLIFSSQRKDFDLPFDIAVFGLDRDVILSGGKNFYQLEEDSPRIQEGEEVLVVGFPGNKRSPSKAKHLWATCRLFSDRKIWLESRLNPREKRWNLGGLSGGPIFRIGKDGSYRLAGIVYAGNESQDVRWPVVNILGFPINRELKDKILNLSQRKPPVPK
ncbi:trypsin-like peptidase domain-containing protein [bacterium]|nr:trypsin-like peptidase domain-containing protein [bacterium]